jgi:EAL domain-containing protein (putative c-di-GMP-specific phosphodiesterase class I)
VEKEGQYAILRERGCDFAQGYWLGHPMSAEEFLELRH